MRQLIRRSLAITTVLFATVAYGQKQKADLIVHNGKIYTVDNKFTIANAMAIRDGKILETGDWKQLSAKYNSKEIIDAKGNYVYPGFIDAHAHFLGYGLTLQRANLVDTKSWDEVLERVKAFAKEKNIAKGEWITGRGWDQNDWQVQEFPTKEKLDQLFPDNPVILTRVDGHAAITNQKALELAGVKSGQTITGGEVQTKNGQLTGILVDNATGLVSRVIPDNTKEQAIEGLKEAAANCYAVGLTTVDDCGLRSGDILLIDSLQRKGELKMRIYAMLSDYKDNYEFAAKRGRIKTDRLNVRAFKIYVDGALGSRGAALIRPYSDRPEWSGMLLSTRSHYDSVAQVIYKLGYQMCTHAIGDSGNRTMINAYSRVLKGKNDLRWRIEHAQVVDGKDFSFFGKYNIIPSVQPTHATSDMYWAAERLGEDRVKDAYAYKWLMKENGWVPLGTDFPVEDISPFKTFHSAVFRRDANEWPKEGYQMENALSREEALRGMTIWAAKSNFEEHEKGSLEKGKLADFIILDKDLMKISSPEVLKTSVLATYIGGEKVYEKK